MFGFFRLWLGAILRLFRSRQDLLMENLALRQQLGVFKRRNRRPKLAVLDKLFWPGVSGLIGKSHCCSSLRKRWSAGIVTDYDFTGA
jgi:hypothetical protein